MGDTWKRAGCVLVLTALPAVGAGGQTGSGEPVAFSRIDSDGNGYLSRTEAQLVVAGERFDAIDRNRDGLLNHREYAALQRRHRIGAADSAR